MSYRARKRACNASHRWSVTLCGPVPRPDGGSSDPFDSSVARFDHNFINMEIIVEDMSYVEEKAGMTRRGYPAVICRRVPLAPPTSPVRRVGAGMVTGSERVGISVELLRRRASAGHMCTAC
jgi:hypothetical protein